MNRTRRVFVLLALVACLAGLVCASPVGALDRAARTKALKSVVQLGPIVEITDEYGDTELRTVGWGSGTLISDDGLILTNYHVVDTSDLELPDNVEVWEDQFSVYVTTRSDRPPTLSYVAEVVAVSEKADLAVLHIVCDVQGEEIDWDEVTLPYLSVGDSDLLESGDAIYIVGYPGIGGETVTFTQGVVSGFTAEKGLGSRAWIKTDATIAGGNSGGAGLNDDGELIGVPTQVGSGGASNGQYVDCRPLADTNGDGELDEDDVCVPVGGFINALRPVNLAEELIAEAVDTLQPKGRPKPTPTPTRSRRGVQVTGVIIDANTKRPIQGALFVALKPGVTYDDWESDDDVYSYAVSDSYGLFTLPDLLMEGESYTIAAGKRGYVPVWEDGCEVTSDTPDVVELTVRLQRN